MNLRKHKHYADQRTEREPHPHANGGAFVKMHRLRRRWGPFPIMPMEIGRFEGFRFITSPKIKVAMLPRDPGKSNFWKNLAKAKPL